MDINNKNPDIILGDTTKPEYLAQGIEWLLRMGAIDTPDVQTALTANIYIISDRIEDVSMVGDMEGFKLLVYIKLEDIRQPRLHNRIIGRLKSILGIKIPQVEELTDSEIGTIAADKLSQALPNYDIRVTFNQEIYKKSKELSEKLKKIRGV